MPPLSLLIKPASGLCNLRCKYCFYHDVSVSRSTESYGLMSTETLETIVKKALGFADGACTFAFQGGEPTLAGLDFFRLLIEFEKKYNKKRVRVHNAIQTNGIIINDAWARFLAENRFLAGVSLDGPQKIHDMHRIDASGEGSFNRVMHAIGLFDRHGVEYNILTVVNAAVARHIQKTYVFFKKHGFRYLQFIPCLDPLQEKPSGHDYSLAPERYANFLKILFDLWYADAINGTPVSIRYFDNLAQMALGYPPETCGMFGQCKCQFVVEADGGVYPCDFYVMDEWLLGNIRDMGFPELKFSENCRRFESVSGHVEPACKECRWFAFCRGGCRRNREPFLGGKPVSNYYCRSYREFFEYAAERLQRVAAVLASGIPGPHK
ncbi:MAG: anaerobic sulfatase maturase [Bacillota bacterium]